MVKSLKNLESKDKRKMNPSQDLIGCDGVVSLFLRSGKMITLPPSLSPPLNITLRVKNGEFSRSFKPVSYNDGFPYWNQHLQIPVHVHASSRHPSNALYLSLEVLDQNQGENAYYVIGVIILHLHDLVPLSQYKTSFRFFSPDKVATPVIGLVKMDVKFMYGIYGYGYSMQIDEHALQSKSENKNILFPKIEPKSFGSDMFDTKDSQQILINRFQSLFPGNFDLAKEWNSNSDYNNAENNQNNNKNKNSNNNHSNDNSDNRNNDQDVFNPNHRTTRKARLENLKKMVMQENHNLSFDLDENAHIIQDQAKEIIVNLVNVRFMNSYMHNSVDVQNRNSEFSTIYTTMGLKNNHEKGNNKKTRNDDKISGNNQEKTNERNSEKGKSKKNKEKKRKYEYSSDQNSMELDEISNSDEKSSSTPTRSLTNSYADNSVSIRSSLSSYSSDSDDYSIDL
ncbi:hypothetical protein TRFO_09211 [Tritrichomonas foetus]|uniref:C2 domain-containing protein n=1 Tax=Tritrichomonas foetus TaxID=1144522 RepID=A0A1J4JJU3_9EUKA|nr:hypothetical protein TRFO_09211 [Tritrichomonas foetus]|eukprot:OHS97795.1 hypothetical protein TRFO_09211 [Tritrichomonas foetus]